VKQDFNGKFNNLHVSVGGLSTNLFLSSLDIINDLLFDDREFKVISLSVTIGSQSTPEFVKFDGIMTDINYKIVKAIYHNKLIEMQTRTDPSREPWI
jgi:hypothetical protein